MGREKNELNHRRQATGRGRTGELHRHKKGALRLKGGTRESLIENWKRNLETNSVHPKRSNIMGLVSKSTGVSRKRLKGGREGTAKKKPRISAGFLLLRDELHEILQ